MPPWLTTFSAEESLWIRIESGSQLVSDEVRLFVADGGNAAQTRRLESVWRISVFCRVAKVVDS